MKHLTGFLALLLSAAFPLLAADLSDLTYTTTDGEVTITDCDEAAAGELVIPDTIEGNPVTSIGRFAFRGCSGLTDITIPDGVTSIGIRAFYNCAILTSITIPDSVTSIGESAFFNCRSLASITIPDSITSIGVFAFYNCAILTSITIPDSVTSIGYGAFSGCTALTMIEVGVGNVNYAEANGVLLNTEMTFLHTYPAGRPVTNYVIPDSVTNIGTGAFYTCAILTSITIPDSVTSIGHYAFRDSSSLTSITFQGAAPTVGLDIFMNVSEGATAYAQEQVVTSFAAEGSIWEGLTVAIQTTTPTITACGFMNATTFFVEFEPAGTGYRVMSSTTLDFGNAVEVTPTLEPTSAEDNRFEFAASGSRNFYRLEPTE
jgi:hypothetical protein